MFTIFIKGLNRNCVHYTCVFSRVKMTFNNYEDTAITLLPYGSLVEYSTVPSFCLEKDLRSCTFVNFCRNFRV